MSPTIPAKRGRPKTSAKVQWKRWVEPAMIPALQAVLDGQTVPVAAVPQPDKAQAPSNDAVALLADVGRLEGEKAELLGRIRDLTNGCTDETVAQLRQRLAKAEARVAELEMEQFS
jgi:hypothetical protein